MCVVIVGTCLRATPVHMMRRMRSSHRSWDPRVRRRSPKRRRRWMSRRRATRRRRNLMSRHQRPKATETRTRRTIPISRRSVSTPPWPRSSWCRSAAPQSAARRASSRAKFAVRRTRRNSGRVPPNSRKRTSPRTAVYARRISLPRLLERMCCGLTWTLWARTRRSRLSACTWNPRASSSITLGPRRNGAANALRNSSAWSRKATSALRQSDANARLRRSGCGRRRPSRR
mmetsp:Transcript_52886/g.104353  ORF Transcript_52886/g.104353 Transcript_52886/m.104353 type:complete len:230 (+) Transcript_52886:1338-2027(+)